MKTKRKPGLTTLYYVIATVIVLVMLLPFFWVVTGSMKTQAEFLTNPGAWLPKNFQFDNFVTLFGEKNFAVYMRNSIVVGIGTVLANVVFCSMAGYALAKLRFRGKRVVFILVMLAMMVPNVALFVPQFMVIVRLGLVSTLLGIALPLLVQPLCVFIMRQFAYSVPTGLIEAARLDGASEIKIFYRIFLPLSGPALATVAILSFLSSWNNFLWPLVVAQSQNVYTAPVGLSIASQAANTVEYGVLLAGALVVLLPILVLFLFLQKYFIQGVAATGIKA